jgi:ATP-dependent exoDNAse (exonuclease V) beta subunit
MLDLDRDSALGLPKVTVLKASAGSGKTYALTARYVQFLLSPVVSRNDLRNILAITFSNNASRDMRAKVLEWLKKLSLRDPLRLSEIAAVTEGGEERAARRAGELIEEILSRYSDFQVRTIDSFMSTVFRASALDFGYSPEFEIVMDAAPIVDYSFSLFLREAPEGSENARLLDETVSAALGFRGGDAAWLWDPSGALLAETRKVEAKLSMLGDAPVASDLRPALRGLEARVGEAFERIARLVEQSGLVPSERSTFPDLLGRVRGGRFSDLIGRGMKSRPVNKPKASDPRQEARYGEIAAAWDEADALVSRYAACWARAYYGPSLRLHAALAATMEKVKRAQATVVIGDINRTLGAWLSQEIVPDIYFRIGERVWHFMVDEFQDTSPLQWRNLFPLVENSLAMGGSLFVVGDTKQAIYGFRQADYTIMRSLVAGSPFPSAPRDVRELGTNRRSRPRVLDLASQVFLENAAGHPEYREAARRSGLDEWKQVPLEGSDPGYAEVVILERDDEDPPERKKLLHIMADLQARGYGWGDIAILASKNEQVVRATSWLNEKAIPFISFSSLDVRTRRVAVEILALLGFLDSPPDDLAFATFLLGDVFARALERRPGGTGPHRVREFLFRGRSDRPLYKAFQREFPDLWKAFFAGLFRSAGYLPLYDLVSEAYARLDVFSLAGEEEATLAKLLEAVKELEGTGSGSLREFLGRAGGDGGEWAIAVPKSPDSVQAMTVHKAKGLGFPVVVALLYGESNRGFEYALLREEGGVGLAKVNAHIAARDETLRQLYEEEETKEKVERLNALYVTLTRAKRELYVIGVKRQREKFPFDLLPSDAFAPSEEKGSHGAEAAPAEPLAALSHVARPAAVAFGRTVLGSEERRRGELVHRMLELTVYADDDLGAQLERAAERAAREARRDPMDAKTLIPGLRRMLESPELGSCFTRAPGRTVFVEKEFCGPDGALSRMDRVVCDPGRVTVIDFKTGAEEPAEHGEQMRTYLRLLSGVYPGRALGAIVAYLDLGVARRIE